eukprot:scaffold7634_cov51-Prasinocladus_malaysianus.AAC.3
MLQEVKISLPIYSQAYPQHYTGLDVMNAILLSALWKHMMIKEFNLMEYEQSQTIARSAMSGILPLP